MTSLPRGRTSEELSRTPSSVSAFDQKRPNSWHEAGVLFMFRIQFGLYLKAQKVLPVSAPGLSWRTCDPHFQGFSCRCVSV